jgi:hypothetical protein
MVEIDLREGLAYSLAFFPDRPVNRRFCLRRQPIEDAKPCQREQVISPVGQFGSETTEHASTNHAIMTFDLTDAETAALAQLLRRTIDEDRYPLSPRLLPLTGCGKIWICCAGTLRDSPSGFLRVK